MLRFYVLYCNKSLFKPKIYKSKRKTYLIEKSLKQHQTVIKQFNSKIGAKKLEFPKFIQNMEWKERLFKKEVNLNSQNSDHFNNLFRAEQENKSSQLKAQIQHWELKDPVTKNTIQNVDKNFEMTQSEKLQNLLCVNEPKDKQIFLKNLVQKALKYLSISMLGHYKKAKTSKQEEILTRSRYKFIKRLMYFTSKSDYFAKSAPKIKINPNETYLVYIDGRSCFNPGTAGVGYFVTDLHGCDIFQNSIRIGFQTYNHAQLLSLFFCLMDCLQNNIKKIRVYGDKSILFNVVNKKNRLRNKRSILINYLNIFMAEQFQEFSLQKIDKKFNIVSAGLAYEAISKQINSTKWKLTITKENQNPLESIKN